jgi:hypothetical protein
MELRHEPMTGSFFGLEFPLPQGGLVALLLVCAAFSAWVVYKSCKTGVHSWRSHNTIRAETPRLFAFQMIVTSLIGVCAALGAAIIFFDLGVKP